MHWHEKTYMRVAVLVVLLLVNIFIWHAGFAGNNGTLTLTFLNIGQGDAIFIEAPNGAQMLIDAGPNMRVLSELGRVMSFFDRSIDLVLATHPDADHIGGFPDVLSRYHVRSFIKTESAGASALFAEVNQRIAEKKVPVHLAHRGERVRLSSDVYLDILFPDHDVAGLDTNDSSIIVRLVYGESEAILTGDAPQKIEEYLVSLDGDSLASDILKVGHHGSRTSSAESFINAVHPAYAIISAGKDNKYGHPHKEVIDLLREKNVETFSTVDGAVIFETDGQNWTRVTR